MAIDTSKELEEIRKEYHNREDKPWGYEKVLINTDKYLTKEAVYQERIYGHPFIITPIKTKPYTSCSRRLY